MSEGEGETATNPYDINHSKYAHFFQFEEMFCGRKLKPSDDGKSYSYSGNFYSHR